MIEFLINIDGHAVVICKGKKTKFGSIWNAVDHFEGCSVVSVTCSSSTFYDLFIHLLCICILFCVFSWVSLFIRYIPDLLSPYTGSSHKKASYQSFEEHASETWTRWPLWGRGKFQLELTRIASQRTKRAIYFRSHVKNNSLNCGQSPVNFSLVTIQTVLLKTCSWLVINGWFSNRTGTSVDDGKARRRD